MAAVIVALPDIEFVSRILHSTWRLAHTLTRPYIPCVGHTHSHGHTFLVCKQSIEPHVPILNGVIQTPTNIAHDVVTMVVRVSVIRALNTTLARLFRTFTGR